VSSTFAAIQSLDVEAGVISLFFLVFRMVSYSLLIFAIDWYAQYGSNSPELPTNFYDMNSASLGFANMLLVPAVFLLFFPFVRIALSTCIDRFAFDWLTGLLGIGTFLALFLCFLYFQRSLFNFAFLSIGLIICLLPLQFDLMKYLASAFAQPGSKLLDGDHKPYRRLFELLDLAGTLLGSVVSSLILEYCGGYPILLRVATFLMGFVFVALCSLPIFGFCESRKKTNLVANQTTKDHHGSKNNRGGYNAFEAKLYLYGTGTKPKVIFKRTVTKFV
jgi:hypothetical protein